MDELIERICPLFYCKALLKVAASCHDRKIASVVYPFEKLKFAKGH